MWPVVLRVPASSGRCSCCFQLVLTLEVVCASHCAICSDCALRWGRAHRATCLLCCAAIVLSIHGSFRRGLRYPFWMVNPSAFWGSRSIFEGLSELYDWPIAGLQHHDSRQEAISTLRLLPNPLRSATTTDVIRSVLERSLWRLHFMGAYRQGFDPNDEMAPLCAGLLEMLHRLQDCYLNGQAFLPEHHR